jgi:hypothetical protein
MNLSETEQYRIQFLYDHFINKGINETERKWRIDKEYIISSLRRNKYNIIKARDDINDIIVNNPNIKTIYKILADGQKQTIFKLKGQEWQIHRKVGTKLLYDGKVYELIKHSNYIEISHCLLKNSEIFGDDNDNVRYLKYKQISDLEAQKLIEEEYNNLKKIYEEQSVKKQEWLQKIDTSYEKAEEQIIETTDLCFNHCSEYCKKIIFNHIDLPSELINHIYSFGIASNCDHDTEIFHHHENLNDLEYMRYEDFPGFVEVSYQYNKATAIKNNQYQKWLKNDIINNF